LGYRPVERNRQVRESLVASTLRSIEDSVCVVNLFSRAIPEKQRGPPMKRVFAIAATALIVACSSQPKIQTGPDAEVTFDGLVRIDNARFLGAWIDPEIDLTQYTKIMPGGAEFQFRNVQETGRLHSARSNEREFWISDSNKQRLIDTVSEIFEEELAASQHFTITDEPGPDTLIIVGALHDIVSRVPPDIVGRGEIWLSSLGEATLVIQLADSLSGDVIYRAVERRAVQRPGGQVQLSNSATNWGEVRRWARRWAVNLREGLDSIHQ
jgi:hypothetical protein